ncbi:MAG: hypothetical protein GEV11_06520 [Streptosporangiales bacterium]|nr:hypothetical protein [Streptosporangiales bacterium]
MMVVAVAACGCAAERPTAGGTTITQAATELQSTLDGSADSIAPHEKPRSKRERRPCDSDDLSSYGYTLFVETRDPRSAGKSIIEYWRKRGLEVTSVSDSSTYSARARTKHIELIVNVFSGESNVMLHGFTNCYPGETPPGWGSTSDTR